MPFPFIPAAIGLSGLLAGLFKSKSQGAQEDEEYQRMLEAWNSNEALRGARLDALSGIMGNVQGSLGKGAPDYTIDPAIMERIKAARPFAGADPSKGRGSGLLAGLFGGLNSGLGSVNLAQQVNEQQNMSICQILPTFPGCSGTGGSSTTPALTSTQTGME